MSFITDPRKARPWQRVSIGVAAVSAFEVVSMHDLLLFMPASPPKQPLGGGRTSFAAVLSRDTLTWQRVRTLPCSLADHRRERSQPDPLVVVQVGPVRDGELRRRTGSKPHDVAGR